jgi:Fic family protein
LCKANRFFLDTNRNQRKVLLVKPFEPEKLPIRDVEWESLIPLIGPANRALAQYDAVLYSLPNPAVLLSPLTTQEAVLSSRIEGTQATLGEVLKYEAGEEPQQESKRQDILEIMNYRRALTSAETELGKRPFNLNLLLTLHNMLLDSVRGRNKGRGQFRKAQNWIGPQDSPIEQAYFVPPSPAVLQEFLDNWEKYYHMERPDALVQLAVVHAQFEILHPFLDGNGRIGRLIVPLYLFEKKILSRPMFYLSSYLDEHKDEYIENLRQLGTSVGSWNNWIRFFLRAITEQAHANYAKARQVLDLYEKLKQQVIRETHSQFAVPLLDRIFERPIFQGSHLAGDNMPSRMTTTNLLSRLKRIGMLKVVREGSGRRAQVLALPELVNLCEGREVI